MKFKEFEKQFEENMKFNEGCCGWDETWIDGLGFEIWKTDGGSYDIETCTEYFDENKCESVYSNQVTIGNYATLRQAYNALVKICLMNNVEF